MLPEVILSTIFFKSEILKVQIEARDIPLHADIFEMDISACMSLQWQFENNQNRWTRRRVTKSFKRWKYWLSSGSSFIDKIFEIGNSKSADRS